MTTKFKKFFQLRKLLLMMETDLGISSLTEDERNLLAAIVDIQDEKGNFETDGLKSHILIAKQSHGSYHRALRSLRENKFIEKRDGRERGFYKLLTLQS